MTTPNPYGTPAPGTFPAPGAAPAPPHAPFPGGAPAGAGLPVGTPGAAQAAPGTPPPPGAPATLGRRAAAYAIDVAVVAAAFLVLAVAAALLEPSVGPLVLVVVGALVAVLAVAWAVVYSAMQGGRGSIGMRVMRLRLVRAEDGLALGFGRALLRNLVWGLAGAVVVGYFSALFDRSGRRQGWHDLAAQALMCDARRDERAVPPGDPAAPGAGAPEGARPAPASPSAPAYSGVIPPRPPLPPRPPAPAPASPGSSPAPAPVHGAARPVSPTPDDLIAFVPGITQERPGSASPTPAPAAAAPDGPSAAAVTGAPAAPGGAEPAPGGRGREEAAPAELEEDTILVRRDDEPDLDETRLVSAPAATLQWDDGARHSVSGRTLFGRNPAPEDGAAAVAVRDETLSLSKTHFEIDVTGEGAVVVDRHSTNGITIVRSGRRIAVAPGERVALESGDALEMGERIATFEAAS